MAKLATAFQDNEGKLHARPIDATIADLTAVLGRIGGDSGITPGIAKVIIDKRSEIERVFADFDAMTEAVPA